MKGGWSVTLLFGAHSDVGKGLSVELRLSMILDTCYGGDVHQMLLALGGIRSRNRDKTTRAHRAAIVAFAAARTAGTFQSLCCVLCVVCCLLVCLFD